MENFKLGKRKESTNVIIEGQSQVNHLLQYQRSYPIYTYSATGKSQRTILLRKYGTPLVVYCFKTKSLILAGDANCI
jgi:hypothetical protein